MSRYASPQQAQVQSTFEGDQFLDKVNMKEDRATLPPGTLALSVNKRLRKKKAETRGGVWPPVFVNILGLSVIRGFGVYSNPNGDELFLVAGDTEIYINKDGTYPTSLEAFGDMADSVEFVQARNKIYLFQGVDTQPLVWDGVDANGFIAITKTHTDDTSTDLIPNAVTAEAASDRFLIKKDKNSVLATDIGDYVSYDPILEVFYVNSGTSDEIVRVFAYAKGIALVFTHRNINALTNYTGDPTLATVELLNSELGLAGRKAVTMLGGDVLFLSEPGGIYRVAAAFESRLQTVPLPVTDPIQPLIERINWAAAGGAVAKSLGEYNYFAVPIDGSLVNNCMIVFNGATNIVEGFDTFPAAFQIDDLCVTLYNGERRLFALDKNSAKIYVMYEGKSDYVYEPLGDTPDVAIEHQIEDVIETRGYATTETGYYARSGYNTSTRHDFKKVEIAVETWTPSIQVTELTESVGADRALNVNPITKSRTEYDTFGRKDWEPTNENDDWGTYGRQDYSVVADDTGFDPGSGIDPDRKQASTLRFSTKARGRFVSYRIANSQGQCDVSNVLVESAGTQREPRRGG
jgi:hypothetical protein